LTIGILWLFKTDWDRKDRTSKALWIPLAYLLLAGSRAVSEWLYVGSSITVPDQYLDGSPLDRFVLASLLAVGVVVLIARSQKVGIFLQANKAILLFLVYCGVSTLWSDYPAVAFKRWIKLLGDFAMVLIVVTDPAPFSAIRRVFARASFVLLPASVLLIKYYPEYGRGYDRWTGSTMYTGVTVNKNLLGMVCLVLGLACGWRVLQVLRNKKDSHRTRLLVVHGGILSIAIWLLWKANSATSTSCFMLGAGLMILTSLPLVARRRTLLHFIVIGSVAALFCSLFVGVVVEALGKDPTLTGRTGLWERLLGMAENPLFGRGFESFWLGRRLEKLWSIYQFHPNEAHNGYLEVYLNLGWTGLAILAVILVTAYRRVIDAVWRQEETGSLRLVYFATLIVYNFTEAAFKMGHPVWIAFLLAMVAERRCFERTVARTSQTRAWDSRSEPATEVAERGAARSGDMKPVPY
jgi:exopolysaccharide production protein ExoQ